MQLIGWLVDEDVAPAVSQTWRPGASAIFLRPGMAGASIALTSPSMQFRCETPPQSLASGIVRRDEPPSYRIARGSMTRIGFPARAK
jgi:hypothetical protein